MKPVLVACEFSATVRDALRATGLDAWSNDLLDTEGDPRWHIKGDYRDAIRLGQWAMIIIHIECTKMALCGNRTYGYGTAKHSERPAAIVEAMEAWELAKRHADCVAMENPASILFKHLRKRKARVQFVQPWQFGHPETKLTGFALHRLPNLIDTNNVFKELAMIPLNQRSRIHYMPDRIGRAQDRSRFYPGMAAAMAQQWGAWISL